MSVSVCLSPFFFFGGGESQSYPAWICLFGTDINEPPVGTFGFPGFGAGAVFVSIPWRKVGRRAEPRCRGWIPLIDPNS